MVVTVLVDLFKCDVTLFSFFLKKKNNYVNQRNGNVNLRSK